MFESRNALPLMGFLAVELPIRRHAALRRLHETQELFPRLGLPLIAPRNFDQIFPHHGVHRRTLVSSHDPHFVQNLLIDRERDIFHFGLQYTVYVELCAVSNPFTWIVSNPFSWILKPVE